MRVTSPTSLFSLNMCYDVTGLELCYDVMDGLVTEPNYNRTDQTGSTLIIKMINKIDNIFINR